MGEAKKLYLGTFVQALTSVFDKKKMFIVHD